MSYNVGDRIRVIAGWDDDMIGREGTVVPPFTVNSEYVEVELDNFPTTWPMTESEIEPA